MRHMFDRTNAFDALQYCSEELRHLSTSPELLVTDEERAILLAQMDTVWDQMEKLACRPRLLSNWPYAALTRLLAPESMEALARRGASPIVVASIRQRRYRTVERFLRALR